MKIAILFDKNEKLHSTNWSIPWVEYCKENTKSLQDYRYDIHTSVKQLEQFYLSNH